MRVRASRFLLHVFVNQRLQRNASEVVHLHQLGEPTEGDVDVGEPAVEGDLHLLWIPKRERLTDPVERRRHMLWILQIEQVQQVPAPDSQDLCSSIDAAIAQGYRES